MLNKICQNGGNLQNVVRENSFAGGGPGAPKFSQSLHSCDG